MTPKQRKNILSSWASFWLPLILGIVVLSSIFAVLTHSGKRSVILKAEDTLNFMKTQCIKRDNYIANDHAKSLIRLLDKTKDLGQWLEANPENVQESFLKEYVTRQRLTGVIIVDANGHLVTEVSQNKVGYSDWQNIITGSNLKDIWQYPQKSYMDRIEIGDQSYDYAAVARLDTSGMIFCYVKKDTAAGDDSQLDVTDMFTGGSFEMNASALITDGKTVLNSNREQYQGKKVKDLPFLQSNRLTKVNSKLIRGKINGQGHYGIYTKYKHYQLYVFYPIFAVYTERTIVIAYCLIIYILIWAMFLFIRQRISQSNIQELNKQYGIISAISSIYADSFFVDLEHNRIEFLKVPKNVDTILGQVKKADELLDKLCDTYIADEYKAAYRAFVNMKTLDERLENKSCISFEYVDIYSTWYQSLIIPQKRSENGKILSVIFAVRNITDEKKREHKYQEELLVSAQEAKKANRAKTDFLRRMSHDIRTPINGIRGMIEIGNHAPDDMERQAECRQKIWEVSGFLLDLVNDMLEMNKLESGEIHLEEKPFNMLTLLKETSATVQTQAEQNAIDFHMEKVEGNHWDLIGSPLHLRRILMNILSNAVKYSRQNDTIRLSCREVKYNKGIATFEFVCAVTGIGMSDEFQKHLFEPFAQENQQVQTVYSGTGLGLSIVKKLVEKMQGEITFSSKEGQGTTFYILLSFPINLCPHLEKAEDTPLQAASIEGARVLLVEDNKLNMEISQFILENQGAIVTQAWNGQETVDLFDKSLPGDFDMILMDLMMPVMDGISATKAIRALDRSDAKTIPIIAMTANAFTDDMERSKAAGMNEHISKPINGDNLIRIIARYFK